MSKVQSQSRETAQNGYLGAEKLRRYAASLCLVLCGCS